MPEVPPSVPIRLLHSFVPGPDGVVNQTPMSSFWQLSPHGLSRTVNLAEVMQEGRLAKVWATQRLTVQSSKPFWIPTRADRSALGEVGSGPVKSSVVVPAS